MALDGEKHVAAVINNSDDNNNVIIIAISRILIVACCSFNNNLLLLLFAGTIGELYKNELGQVNHGERVNSTRDRREECGLPS